jgi:hypothetical protein
MKTPKTDDFRLEREGDELVVTFTPTGARYRFRTDRPDPHEPERTEPPRTQAPDYSEADIRRMSVQLAQLASSKPPQT